MSSPTILFHFVSTFPYLTFKVHILGLINLVHFFYHVLFSHEVHSSPPHAPSTPSSCPLYHSPHLFQPLNSTFLPSSFTPFFSNSFPTSFPPFPSCALPLHSSLSLFTSYRSLSFSSSSSTNLFFSPILLLPLPPLCLIIPLLFFSFLFSSCMHPYLLPLFTSFSNSFLSSLHVSTLVHYSSPSSDAM